jgi:hypothetical protein
MSWNIHACGAFPDHGDRLGDSLRTIIFFLSPLIGCYKYEARKPTKTQVFK